MRFNIVSTALNTISGDVCVLGIYKEKGLPKQVSDIDRSCGGMIKEAMRYGFNAEFGRQCLLHVDKGIKAKRILLLGLGKRSELDLKKIRILLARMCLYLRQQNTKSYCMQLIRSSDRRDSFSDTVEAHITSHESALYEFNQYKTERKEEYIPIVEASFVCLASELKSAKESAKKAHHVVQAMNLIRNLVNEPSNMLTPSNLARYAVSMSKRDGISCKVYGRKEIEKMGMRAFLGVAKGSAEEPKFIVMEHKPKKSHGKICVVGKGITFDSGGISIKPSKGMDEMKMDMGGAAATIGIMDAVARLKIPVHVYGIVAACENMPSGTAQKPGDVVETMSGKTVEIANTDAEGRLILADALHYATTLKPDAIVDLATLTGAVVVALGSHATGMFTNNSVLAKTMEAAAFQSGEAVWRLPVWEDYQEDVKSDIADIKNIGLPMEAGSITAAMFLKFFIGKTPWIHLDIAGTAWTDGRKHIGVKGATGSGVRLVTRFIEEISEMKASRR
ncbi:leucyl aminopeptidase [Candidatus Woesearchaeota archaeon CG11_big_fil_rev_8_21_14_0_20_43_8]|nr:MAG: leucyl aminopeptidase [Candidatus Woesearchaeota archaeon CG11_big_fil_rev_8_21_14_0_20_43_8]PIO05193.1 MAG: leucyl aminopeptidase [Candidatus Woesearchaeota archaeon CG08_land_8_20_14_0_20_43_7]